MALELMGEYIFFSLSDAGLRSREVYDFFFVLDEDWQDATLLVLSPQVLLNEADELMVKAVKSPGAGGPDDVVYTVGAGHQAEYDEEKQQFSVVMTFNETYVPQTRQYEGKVIVPQVSIPAGIQDDAAVLDMMRSCGTLFELRMGNLSGGAKYAMRVEVEPYRVLGPEATHDWRLGPDEGLQGLWVHERKAFCPKTALLNFREFLVYARGHTWAAAGAASIQTILARYGHVVPVNRQRLLAVAPLRSEIEVSAPPGSIWLAGKYQIAGMRAACAGMRAACEWSGGRETYWMDDVEYTAGRIVDYLRDYAAASAKTKEEVTSAINVLHLHTAAIIDFLCDEKVVAEASKTDGTYRLHENLPKNKIRNTLRKAAADQKLLHNFKWIGYQISYTIRYRWLSRSLQRRLRWIRFKREWAFWLALVGILLTCLALVLALVEWTSHHAIGN